MKEIKVDGEYPFDKQYVRWHKVLEISEKVAYELFCDVLRKAEKVDESEIPSITIFSDRFLNKGYKFLTLSRGVEHALWLALYKHDSYWHLITVNADEFIKGHMRSYKEST